MAVVWTDGNIGASTGNPVTATLPASPAVGDLVLVFMEVGFSQTVATPSGWSLLSVSPLSRNNITTRATKNYGFYRIYESGDTNPSFTMSGTVDHTVWLTARISGLTASPFGTSNTSTSTSSAGSPNTISIWDGPTVAGAEAGQYVLFGTSFGYDSSSALVPYGATGNIDSPTAATYHEHSSALGDGGGLMLGITTIPSAGTTGYLTFSQSTGGIQSDSASFMYLLNEPSLTPPYVVSRLVMRS